MSIEKQNGAMTEAIYYILLSLFEPLHGYGIIQNVERLSEGRVRLAPGTLYGALPVLQKKGWIQPALKDPQGRKKEYQITDRGRLAVQAELLRLRELVENGIHVIERELSKKSESAAEAGRQEPDPFELIRDILTIRNR